MRGEDVIRPAIVIATYNRPQSLIRLLESVNAAFYSIDNITLIISIDNSGNDISLNIAKQFDWKYGEKIIRTFEERQGLKKHLLSCGDLTLQYEAVIVLEDDLVVSEYFYQYTMEALEFYKNEERITGVALYSHEWNGYASRFFAPIKDQYDVFFGAFSETWGQCWTAKWWNSFKKWYLDNEGKDFTKLSSLPQSVSKWGPQSWGKYFFEYVAERGLYYVIPRDSYTTNCGECGQHQKLNDNSRQVSMFVGEKKDYRFPSFEKGIKYDPFMENLSLVEKLEEKTGTPDICIDLNATPGRSYSSRFVLTTKNLNYKIVESFGIEYRPIEMNVLRKTKGEGIFLYDMNMSQKNRNDDFFQLMRYELRGYNWKVCLLYGIRRLFFRIRGSK